MGNQVTARRRRPGASATGPLNQCLIDLGPQSTDVDLEAGAVQRPVPNSMPPDEHPVGQVQQFLPDGCPAVLPINQRLKVPTQMRPTELATAKAVVSLPAIRRNHLSARRTK